MNITGDLLTGWVDFHIMTFSKKSPEPFMIEYLNGKLSFPGLICFLKSLKKQTNHKTLGGCMENA